MTSLQLSVGFIENFGIDIVEVVHGTYPGWVESGCMSLGHCALVVETQMNKETTRATPKLNVVNFFIAIFKVNTKEVNPLKSSID
jgi:hypothetical protein